MERTAIKELINSAIQGDTKPFNLFFEKTYKTLQPRIQHLTKSNDVTKEVFIIAMEKFWECFVINRQIVPHNSIGYIFTISKNIWLLQKEKNNQLTFMDDKTLDHYKNKTEESSGTNHVDLQSETDEQSLKHKALAIAIELLPTKCKALIENDLDPKSTLKGLQKTMGYDTYQALVQAKYNCKKKLIKMVHKTLVELKSGVSKQ